MFIVFVSIEISPMFVFWFCVLFLFYMYILFFAREDNSCVNICCNTEWCPCNRWRLPGNVLIICALHYQGSKLNCSYSVFKQRDIQQFCYEPFCCFTWEEKSCWKLCPLIDSLITSLCVCRAYVESFPPFVINLSPFVCFENCYPFLWLPPIFMRLLVSLLCMSPCLNSCYVFLKKFDTTILVPFVFNLCIFQFHII